MELKDILLIIVTSIAAISSLGGFLRGIRDSREKKALAQDNKELNQKIFTLQKAMYKLQEEQENKKALTERIEEENKIAEEKSDTQLYFDHIIDKFQFLEFTGLDASGQKSLKLEHIYVKLKTRPKPENNLRKTIDDFEQFAQENSDDRYEEAGPKARELADILEEKIEQSEKENCSLKMLILGHPGSGKTTLMKWIALQCAGQKIKFLAGKLPIFIALKDLGKDPDGTFKNLGIEKLVKKQIEHESLESKFFDRHFQKKEVIFLLDGLDEVADEKIRRDVIEWIKKQNIRGNTLIVTSRLSGIQAEKGLKFPPVWPVFHIREFDLNDIEFFLKNWYENVEKAMEENSETNALKIAEKRSKKLIEIIISNQYEKLRELAVNPLLLTIIAIVHRTRATLPKERHKLYEECVKVMIELWNVANRNLYINFSVDNSINYLSKIAAHLMKENLREAPLHVIETILPSEIEGHPVCFFLEEMVLKAGLLYKSNGQYGFLHLTFQEYLAAWNFSKGDNPEAILEYRDKDYWTETFKLFVNISNTRRFFNTVLKRLEIENYWRQMLLWESCLLDIAIEDTQLEIELKFAGHILKRLPQLERSAIDEKKLNLYYTHYTIFKHYEKFPNEAWDLFSYPQHPFVQAIGATLLSLGDPQSRDKLINTTKKQIDDFMKLPNPSPLQAKDFFFRHCISSFLLIVTREKLSDFQYTINKLKINIPLILLIILRDLRYLRDLLDLLNLRYLEDLRYLLDLLELLGRLDLRDLLDLLDFRYLLDLRYLRYLLGFRDLRDLRDLKDLRDLRSLLKEFYQKYETQIQKNKDKISQWADQALDRLHELPDDELRKYFPGTTEEELREFREERRQEKEGLQQG